MKSKIYLNFLSLTGIVLNATNVHSQTYQPSNRIPVADNTLGTQVSGSSSSFTVTGGLSRGQNLFHSFQDFSVPTNGAVTFSNPAGDRSIITRVTGNLFSDINGKIDTSGANFFLINPNGIVFGNNAQLNVGKMFVGSTANGIDFVDAQGKAYTFGTKNINDAPFLTVNPNVVFNPARLIIGGSGTKGIENYGNLETINQGQYIGLIGGNINFNGGKVNAPGGRIELGGLSAPGTVSLGTEGNMLRAQFPIDVGRGDISFSNLSRVLVAGSGGGDIAISARNLELSSGSVISGGIGEGLGTPQAVGGDIKINAMGKMSLMGVDTAILNQVRSNSKGNAGDITIEAASLSLKNGGGIIASTVGNGDAGNVTVTVKDAILQSGISSNINSNVEKSGVGNGGDIRIKASSFSLQDGAQVQTLTREEYGTQPAGKGNAGNIFIDVSGAVDIFGANSINNTFHSAIISNIGKGAEGKGGNITINAGSFSLRDTAGITASTSGTGSGGNITVTAKDTVFLAHSDIYSRVDPGGIGNGGNITINGNLFSAQDNANLITSTFGTGNSGDINVNVNSLSLKNGGGIIASTVGNGDAGNVTVTVKDAILQSGISSNINSNVEKSGVGNGGDIRIKASSFSLQDGAQVQTLTREEYGTQPAGKGNAGNIFIDVSGAVDIFGANSINNTFHSAIISNIGKGAKGKGGNITIDAGSFSLRDTAGITASTAGTGSGGNITVTTKDTVFLDHSDIYSTVDAGGFGKGGNITINTKLFSAQDNSNLRTSSSGTGNSGDINVNVNSLSFTNRAGIVASTIGTGNAGNVTVTSKDNVSLANSGIFSTVEKSGVGNGGNITINTNLLSAQDNSNLKTSSSGMGKSGNINVNVNSLSLKSGAGIVASTAGTGDAGNVTVTAKDAIFQSGISSNISSTVENNGVGNGGDIKINAGSLTLQDGSQMQTSTSGMGSAGDVTITTKDTVSLANSGFFSTVEKSGVGNGGNITINTKLFSAQDNSNLAASTLGTGNAGNIFLDSNLLTLNKSSISSAANSSTGGNINLTTNDLLFMRNSSNISTDSTSDLKNGNGGNITINSPLIIATQGNNDVSANASAGAGGKVNITSQGLFGIQFRPKGQDSPLTSDITASSTFGQNGTVNINTPGIDPGKDANQLPTVPTDASNQISQTCSPSNRDSKFAVTGRGGLPKNAYDLLSSDVVWKDPRAVNQPIVSNTGNQPTKKISSPAIGWVFDGKGKVTLIAAESQGQPTGTRVVCPNGGGK
jgi:filamentous hemagglutinin family protein